MKHPRTNPYIGFLVLSLLGMTLFSFTTVSSNSAGNELTNWITYHDPVYDFSVDYPSNWEVISRDELGAAGVVMFRQPTLETDTSHDHHTSSPLVAINFYLVAWDKQLSVTEWTEQYNDNNILFNEFEIKNKQRYEIEVDRLTSLYVEGASPLTPFRYVNVPRGNIVWFIWSNLDANMADTFSSVIASFRFGEATPETLQDILGSEFSPFPLVSSFENSLTEDSGQDHEASWLPTRQANLNGWRVPLNGGTWNATCHSSYHNNNRSRYAIDVARPEGTSVYAANSGTVVTLGWDAAGFGNYVRIQTSSYYHYYAHLSSFDESILFPPYTITKGARVGYSGNTGASYGAHLHFEVRNSSNTGVSLVGMSGFTALVYPYPGNPNATPPGKCGTLYY